MKIFIQSADLEELDRLSTLGVMDGVALPITEFSGRDAREDIETRLAGITHGFGTPIWVSVGAITSEEMYQEGRDLARMSDLVVVQIPFVDDAMDPIRRLVADGIRVCVTHVYTSAQAFFAAKMGATTVMMPIEDLDDYGAHGPDVVSETRALFDRAECECDIAVPLTTRASYFTTCVLAGADAICIAPDMLRELMRHALTDRGVDRFLRDLSQRHRPRDL